MAKEAKTATKKQKSTGKARSAKASSDKSALRQAGDVRTERRFLPKTSAGAVFGTLATSIGAVAVGAGVFARFVSNPPHDYAVYLLAVGGLLALIGIFAGGRPTVIRVGDAGVAIEKEADDIERLAWHEIDTVRFAQNTISFAGGGRILSISTVAQPDAAAIALTEARARIPSRASGVTEDLPAPAAGAGELVNLDPIQLAGLRCKKSDRIIAVEKDGRFCARCGQTYHKDAVPPNCLSCDARLG